MPPNRAARALACPPCGGRSHPTQLQAGELQREEGGGPLLPDDAVLCHRQREHRLPPLCAPHTGSLIPLLGLESACLSSVRMCVRARVQAHMHMLMRTNLHIHFPTSLFCNLILNRNDYL